LTISDIPFDDPIGACRIGYLNGELVVNPTFEQLEESKLDLTVAGTGDAIMMVESAANEIDEKILVDALKLAQEVNGRIVGLIREMQSRLGKPKWAVPADEAWDAALAEARTFLGSRIAEALKLPGGKKDRQDRLRQLKDEMVAALCEKHEQSILSGVFDDIEGEVVREAILTEGRRPDGRAPDAIRQLWSQTAYLPRAHGSAIFTRGETQVLSVVTLGSMGDHQKIDSLSPETEKYFMHHYNFPGFSTGEVRRMGTGRREIGHGALAERALGPVLPDTESFPYTIRIVSDVLSSNGSSSMASVCGGTLALMDAGVPIRAPVAGIAMGLITGSGGRTAILTDIQGAEDHSGDMDFKVAGTEAGVTALQMDIKIKGITYAVMDRALEQARGARLQILSHMKETIAVPKPELSRYAPRMLRIQIPVDKIGTVIGPGGKMIRSMIERWGVSIDIEDDGTVVVGSTDRDAAEAAIAQIRSMTKEIEVGDEYRGRVSRLMPFGAMVEIMPGKDGLVHASEFGTPRGTPLEQAVKVGDELEVVVVEIDHLNRVNLSLKGKKEGAESVEEEAAAVAEDERPPAQIRVRTERPDYGPGRQERRRQFGGPRPEEGGPERGPRPEEPRPERGPRPRRRQVGGFGGNIPQEPQRPPRREGRRYDEDH
ncbi:MAG: polyribonucleotide nucleotidyltransferase, partial [Chloroflexi bacterium]|nr:polyribonucleotide nucleotidyltransferase [Chloroflexota bacterium]